MKSTLKLVCSDENFWAERLLCTIKLSDCMIAFNKMPAALIDTDIYVYVVDLKLRERFVRIVYGKKRLETGRNSICSRTGETGR